MRRSPHFWLVAGLVLMLGCSGEPTAPGAALGGAAGAKVGAWDDASFVSVMEFDDSEIFLEWNSTDGDLGVQVFLDGEDWKQLKIVNSAGNQILDIGAHKALAELGLTELRFESAEPSPEEVLELFGPGPYEFIGRSTDNVKLEGDGELFLELLDPPVITVVPASGVVNWNAVPGADHYEIIVENEEAGLEFFVQLPGGATSVTIPSEFLEPGTLYKAEVLAVAENGNKTITEMVFSTP